MAGPRILILGGGMVGQLAAFLFPTATILDWRMQPAGRKSLFAGIKLLGAMYLWEPLEGLPCESFSVHTTVDGEPATEESVARYKDKIGKSGDLAQWRVQFNPLTVGWRLTSIPNEAPRIIYRAFVDRIDVNARMLYMRSGDKHTYDLLISTIPLPSLMDMVGMRRVTPFVHHDIAVKESPTPLDVPWARTAGEVLRVNYLSNPQMAVYRTTDWKGNRHYEWLKDHPLSKGMGMPTKVISPGKILMNNYSGSTIRDLAYCRIHPFGRFGRWEPDELIHMTYKDMFRFRLDVSEGRLW